MLESEIKKLTAAVEANTAARTGGAAPAVTGAVAKPAAASVVPEAPAAAPVVPGGIEAALAAAAPAAAAPAAAAAAAAPEPVVVEVDKKALTQKFIELAQSQGREVAQQLLAEYGIASLPELKDKALWPAFFAACDAKITP